MNIGKTLLWGAAIAGVAYAAKVLADDPKVRRAISDMGDKLSSQFDELMHNMRGQAHNAREFADSTMARAQHDPELGMRG